MTHIKQESADNEIAKDVSSGLIIMIECSKDAYLKVAAKVIKGLTDKGYFAVVLSTATPTSDLMKSLKQHNTDISHIFFIDSLSRAKEKGERIILISSLSDLTAIAAAFDTVCSSLEKENDFFYIDSVQDLLKEKDEISVTKALHTIFSKMRLYGVGGVIVSIGSINGETRAEIAQLCDEIKKQ